MVLQQLLFQLTWERRSKIWCQYISTGIECLKSIQQTASSCHQIFKSSLLYICISTRIFQLTWNICDWFFHCAAWVIIRALLVWRFNNCMYGQFPPHFTLVINHLKLQFDQSLSITSLVILLWIQPIRLDWSPSLPGSFTVLRVTHVIMGADINVKLGWQNCDELRPVLGPHWPSRRNTRGTNLLSLYLSNGLRIENTFFAAWSHYTFSNINDGDQTMIDIFVCSQQLHCRVNNCRITPDGVESNHTVVRLDLTMTSLNIRQLPHFPVVPLTGARLHLIKQRLSTTTIFSLPPPNQWVAMPYEDFNELIIATGTEAALLVKSTCKGWFQFSVSDLAPTIAERNELLNALHLAKAPPALHCHDPITLTLTLTLKIKSSSWKQSGLLTSVPRFVTWWWTRTLHGNKSAYSPEARRST